MNGRKALEEYSKSGCLHDEHWHCRPELRSIRILVGLFPVTLCNREKQMYGESLLCFLALSRLYLSE